MNIRNVFKRFIDNKAASILPTFAIMIVPMMIGVGIAIDYTQLAKKVGYTASNVFRYFKRDEDERSTPKQPVILVCMMEIAQMLREDADALRNNLDTVYDKPAPRRT